MKKIAAFLSSFIVPVITFAHPGHGDTDGYSIIHYFKEPVHLAVFTSIILVAVLYFRYVKRKGQRQ